MPGQNHAEPLQKVRLLCGTENKTENRKMPGGEMEMKKGYAKGYFLMGVADILSGVVLMLYAVCVFVNPVRYVNEQGQT